VGEFLWATTNEHLEIRTPPSSTREGTYEEALNELSPTLAKDVRRKVKHALMVSNSLGMSSRKVVPFQNLAEEAQEAAPQGIATGITVEIPGAVPVTGEVIAPLAGGTSEAKAGPDTDVLMPLGKEGSAEEKDGGEKSIKLASADAMLDDFAFPDELRPKVCVNASWCCHFMLFPFFMVFY
jgi:hypothetical protein